MTISCSPLQLLQLKATVQEHDTTLKINTVLVALMAQKLGVLPEALLPAQQQMPPGPPPRDVQGLHPANTANFTRSMHPTGIPPVAPPVPSLARSGVTPSMQPTGIPPGSPPGPVQVQRLVVQPTAILPVSQSARPEVRHPAMKTMPPLMDPFMCM
jgi:hypothetical protein